MTKNGTSTGPHGLRPDDEPAPLTEPVRSPSFGEERPPEPGLALCLSGGGYRAMIFHVGVLWRLNEAGLLGELERISSVSGGSITAGVLAMNWSKLDFAASGVARRFTDLVVDPVRRLAGRTIDVQAVLTGTTLPFTSVSDRIVAAYRKHLFGHVTLQEFPDHPRFIINATNLESSVLMRFSKPYLADYLVGMVEDPDLELAVLVAASSAFPPFLSPCEVDLSRMAWITQPGNVLTTGGHRGKVSLTDGGVYDNLGLETVWKRYQTILVSDGGGGPVAAMPDVPSDWARQILRVLFIMDGQVRALRKRQVVDSLKEGRRSGMYVGISSSLTKYPIDDPLDVDPSHARRLADTPTRLAAMPDELQESLINWGYAVCDAGLRSFVRPNSGRGTLPYPQV